MEIYKNGVHLLTIPTTIRQKGCVCTRLSGFNLLQTPESSELQAVYKSLIGKSVSGDVTIIDIVLGKKNFSLFFFPRFPYFSITFGNHMEFSQSGDREGYSLLNKSRTK